MNIERKKHLKAAIKSMKDAEASLNAFSRGVISDKSDSDVSIVADGTVIVVNAVNIFLREKRLLLKKKVEKQTCGNR